MSGQLVVCQNCESAVIKCRVSEAWTTVKKLNFAELTPSAVTSCSLLVPSDVVPKRSSSASSSTVMLEDIQYSDLPIDSAGLSPFLCASSIGSLRHVVYNDAAEFVFRVVEMSDVQRQVSYELIQTDATVNVSSVLHTIQLLEITESNETLISWTTEFSGDCDLHVYNDAKYKKLDAFKDLKTLLEKS